jgi:CRISPR/Cas system-associated endonuclease Cas1
LQKISAKYLQQIEAYEKKGLNALTKKLIEKTQLEMQKAETKRKDELERERQEEIDKILNGVSSLGISQVDLQIEELKSRE